MGEYETLTPKQYAERRGITLQRVNKVLKEIETLQYSGEKEAAQKRMEFFPGLTMIRMTGRGREREMIFESSGD